MRTFDCVFFSFSVFPTLDGLLASLVDEAQWWLPTSADSNYGRSKCVTLFFLNKKILQRFLPLLGSTFKMLQLKTID
jgi:hypothetical protein